jgi:DNA repair protein RecN (Recombination protein N)
MLRELRLRHYAIIDEMTIPFSEGLNIITGETGAGKSILIEALALLLGDRFDSEGVRHESDEAILEGFFDPLRVTSDSYENDPDGLIIKRVLSKSKGRAYINGSLANLSTLKQVGQSLAEIHGQNDHYQLTNANYPLSTLDAYGKLLEQKTCYKEHFRDYARLVNEIADLKRELCEKKEGEGGRREDFILYQLSEIREAHLEPGEDEQLEKEDHLFKNREAILSCTQGGYDLLSEEGGILSQVGAIERLLGTLEQVTKDTDVERDLLDTAKANLKELALALRNRAHSVVYDPERQRIVTERIYLIQKMKKKYGGSIEAILDFKNRLEQESARLSEQEARLPAMERAQKELLQQITKEAESLSKARNKTIGQFEKRVKEELDSLGMEKTRFEISNQPRPISEDGIDHVQFLIGLPGEVSKPIAKVASGGELSRIMLALKVALAEIDPVPTFVFDEIDAGVGGAVAERIGKRLSRLSKSHQIFCITHLPQIARFADYHYAVEKKTVGNRMSASIRKLSKDERVLELARMLGGVEMTAATLRHAEELGKGMPSH